MRGMLKGRRVHAVVRRRAAIVHFSPMQSDGLLPRIFATHKMLRPILYSLVLLFLANTGPSFGQQPPHPQLEPAELKELIRLASLSLSEYRAKFKDLTADEEQKVEEYDSEGNLKRRRRIVSDLVIYQSQLDTS